MLLTKLIEGRATDNGGRYSNVCNALITYELIEVSHLNPVEYEDDSLVIHRVQLMPTSDTDFLVDCPLDDSDVRAHFEHLLSAYCHDLDVSTAREEMA